MKTQIIRNIRNSSLRDNEDLPVLDYIDKIAHKGIITLLEVGCGECRFVKKIRQQYPNIEITCIEINPSLANIAKDLDCNVINEDVLSLQATRKYDIVHCSHVIEHFSYPDITKVLDFLAASVEPDGRIIIRSPLIDDKDTWCFYGNIDHIKPYPPSAIINYFCLEQQQKKGLADIAVEHLWYRTSPKQYEKLSPWHLAYGLHLLRLPMNYCIGFFNRVNEYLWKRFRWPSTRPHGYVMIIRVLLN